MNEFVGKKLGEVLAFSNIGIEMLERGEGALKDTLPGYKGAKEAFSKQADEVKEVAESGGVGGVTAAKAEATGNKLRGMMETYIGDEWGNSAELLEWMGFFEGAAVVHWRLVEGAANSLGDGTLRRLSQEGVKLHRDLLSQAEESIAGVGSKRAKE